MVVEGIDATKAAYLLARKMEIEMPIVEQLHAVLCEGADIRQALKKVNVAYHAAMKMNQYGWNNDILKTDRQTILIVCLCLYKNKNSP